MEEKGCPQNHKGREQQHRKQHPWQKQGHQQAQVVGSHGLKLGRFLGGVGQKTADKHQKQPQANEAKTERGQKGHAHNQGLHGRGDALGDGRAVTGWVQGVVGQHFLAQAQTQPSQ